MFDTPTQPNSPVPAPIEAIDLLVRTYRSALKSNREVTINSLTNYYSRVEPILHPHVSSSYPDIDSFGYALLRLPQEIDFCNLILCAQIPETYEKNNFDVTSWPQVTAPARRRPMRFQKSSKILAPFIASISDIDDIVNLLIAYQIEWNKLHDILRNNFSTSKKLSHMIDQDISDKTHPILPSTELKSLKKALGPKWRLRLRRIYKKPKNLRLRLLTGSWIDYLKVTQKWWKNISKTTGLELPKTHQLHMSRQKIYFVSSNTHSLKNLIVGYPIKKQNQITTFLKQNKPDLFQTWQKITQGELPIHPNDFLYYASRFCFTSECLDIQQKLESDLKYITIPPSHYLEITTQLFPIKNLLKCPDLDSRLKIKKPSKIAESDALIFNIDYPLGFAAYHILTEVLSNVAEVRGVYVTGKAATLNCEIGDVQIPRAVFDEHTQNTYMLRNCFNRFFPFLNSQGSILTEQKAVSVLGTYLQNQSLINKYSEHDITVVEMESGPYLGAICEATYDSRAPRGTIVDLNNAPFDLGIINYTSDTPYSKAKNLGAGSLDLRGVEPVYLASLAILQRIIRQEENT